jgi:hypothetical protein
MNFIRVFILLAFTVAALPVRAADDAQDWESFGHVLTLLQTAVRLGASPYPDQEMAALLAGRNQQVNQAVASLFAGATAEMPAEYRDRVASLGREFATLALKSPASTSTQAVSVDRSLQARKDLTAMGLNYHDQGEFLDAVKRNDQLAVELFIAGRGVDVGKRSWTGRSALDIARDNGNTQLAELISRNLPPAR